MQLKTHIKSSSIPIPDSRFPMPNAQCPMPNAQCPMPNAQKKPRQLAGVFFNNLTG
ncbi:MAG: hypothetical protein F6J93_06305 [Oscillatoria sp. SIO1A7]|nr:hypothetical protein [Oscillatoria sp. SIO1A7]